MADITMCTQKSCPNEAHCYRRQAKITQPQYWANFEHVVTEKGVICEHYIPMAENENG